MFARRWYQVALAAVAVSSGGPAGAQQVERVALERAAVARSTVWAGDTVARDTTRRVGAGGALLEERGRQVPRTRWQGARRGARNGAIVGASVTLVVGAVALHQDLVAPSSDGVSGTPLAVVLGAAATVVTTVLGSAIGAVAPGWGSVR